MTVKIKAHDGESKTGLFLISATIDEGSYYGDGKDIVQSALTRVSDTYSKLAGVAGDFRISHDESVPQDAPHCDCGDFDSLYESSLHTLSILVFAPIPVPGGGEYSRTALIVSNGIKREIRRLVSDKGVEQPTCIKSTLMHVSDS